MDTFCWRNGDVPCAHGLCLVVTGPVGRGDFTLSTAEASSTRSCARVWIRKRKRTLIFPPDSVPSVSCHFLLSYPVCGPLPSRWQRSLCPPPCHWRRRWCEVCCHSSPGLLGLHGCRMCLRRRSGEHVRVSLTLLTTSVLSCVWWSKSLNIWITCLLLLLSHFYIKHAWHVFMCTWHLRLRQEILGWRVLYVYCTIKKTKGNTRLLSWSEGNIKK